MVLADPAANAQAIIEQVRVLSDRGVALAVFPELSLTGYSIDDLVLADVLLADVLSAIETIRAASAELLPAIVVGAPLREGDRFYNCAVVIVGGEVRGVIPKVYLPNTGSSTTSATSPTARPPTPPGSTCPVCAAAVMTGPMPPIPVLLSASTCFSRSRTWRT